MKRLLILISFLLISPRLYAADWTAASCSLADVTTAYNSASDGDRVLLPTCTETTWAGHLTVSKAIQIVGNGEANTLLRNAGFIITVPDGKGWRVTAMRLRGSAVGFHVTGFSKSGRIDHITFSAIPGATEAAAEQLGGFTADNRVIFLNPASGGFNAGLIDHVTFALPANNTDGSGVVLRDIQIHVRETDSNDSWIRPLDLGGTDAWYIEDSTFNQDATVHCGAGLTSTCYNVSAPITDCDGGGRIVFRHNTINNNYTEMHDAIVAGIRSCRKWEIYANNWTSSAADLSASGQFAQMGIRGGTGVVYDNVFAHSTGFDMVLGNYRAGGQTSGATNDPWNVTCQLSGSTKACLGKSVVTNFIQCTTDSDCGTGMTGACIKIDGSGSPTNYRCRDQIGSDSNNPQQGRPALFWNNTITSVGQVAPSLQGYYDVAYTVEGTDYCVGPTTSSLDDTTKPTSCGGRATPYTSYTYPHPLQSGFQAPKQPTSVH